jgi:hypothetical protein
MNEILEFDLLRNVTTQFTPPSYTMTFADRGAQITFLQGPTTSSAIALDANTATWVREAMKKLESIGRLPRNWDSYDGLPLSPAAKRMTFDALGWLKYQDLPVPAVVLGSAGAVHLEWRSNGKELEIGFGDHGAVEYLKVDELGNYEEEDEINSEVREKLTKLAEWLRLA